MRVRQGELQLKDPFELYEVSTISIVNVSLMHVVLTMLFLLASNI